jgi:uncharacterized membrane protein YidH (DUF202 family)
MIKVFFLIFEPGVAWDRIVQARRSFAYVFGLHLLPLVLLATVVEGWGLARWGNWQPQFNKIRDFPLGTVIAFEAIQAVMFVAMVLISAFLILNMSQTFDSRRSFYQSFTTVAYSFSPLFLVHTLNAGPMVNPWMLWAVGIVLTIWILYQGIPRSMQPDSTHAFGLYLSAIVVVLLMSGIVRVLTALFLVGQVNFQHSWLAHKFPGLFQ